MKRNAYARRGRLARRDLRRPADARAAVPAKAVNERTSPEVREGSLSCKNALAVALTPSAVLAVLQQPTDGLGGSYALIAATSGLVPMMFRTRVIL